MIEDLDLRIEPQTQKSYYYYKRWMWMNFPLVCLSSQRYSYSDLINYCYQEDQNFMNFNGENYFFLKAIEIVFKHKRKKDTVISSHKILVPVRQSTNRNSHLELVNHFKNHSQISIKKISKEMSQSSMRLGPEKKSMIQGKENRQS